jgi:hypothetical protein
MNSWIATGETSWENGPDLQTVYEWGNSRMLTPAEEVGLSGSRLASLVSKVFHTLPESALFALISDLHAESTRRHLFYLRDGEVETIRVLPRPLTALPEQMAYIHFVSLTILNALKRLPDLYLQDENIRHLLRLAPAEQRWLNDCWGPSQRESNPVFGRLDAMVDFTSAMWKDSLRFVEPNLSGVGGIHLVPTCERLIADLVLPILHGQDPQLRLQIGQDVRELLIQEVLDHLEAIGRKAQNVCFVEPKYAEYGPDEQEALAQYYHERHGMKIMHADPAELELRGDEVYYQGDPVDLAYRDYEVRDLIELEQEGINVEPMRMLFRQNRVMSSMAGDFDHKSCWEILTDPQITQKYFNTDERQVFRRHILWTRVLADRRTRLPDGSTGDLLKFVHAEHESLVLKPNRSYGGDRILIGHTISAAEWDSAIDQALADTEDWVVQQLANIPVYEFPVAGTDGKVHIEPFYTVMGFAPTRYGLATLGRASQKQVVNVAQRGGMCAVLLGHPPAGPLAEPAVLHRSGDRNFASQMSH